MSFYRTRPVTHHDHIKGTIAIPAGQAFTAPTTDTYSNGCDWIAVERAVHGELSGRCLNDNELREASLFLRRSGVPRKTVSVRLAVYERLIRDWEAAAGMLPAADLCTTPGCQRAKSSRGLCCHCRSEHNNRERKEREAAVLLEVAA